MPIGALIGAAAGSGAVRSAAGNLIGGLFRRITGRRRRSRAAEESVAPPEAPMGGGVSSPAPMVVPVAPPTPLAPPTPPVAPDTYDQTGRAIGTAVGGMVGAPFGPAGSVGFGAFGGALGSAVGNLIPVNRSTTGGSPMPQQTAINPLVGALLGGGSRNSRRVALDLLLSSGALNGIARAPVTYTAPDGRVRYGSDPGYVLVTRRSGNMIQRVQMPRFIARELGYWKPRRRPLISVRDSNAIRRSNSARRRLQRAAKGAGLYVRERAPARRTSNTRTTRRRR